MRFLVPSSFLQEILVYLFPGLLVVFSPGPSVVSLKTGELVRRAIAQFPVLTPLELEKRTPSGTFFWPGRFRFELNELRKRGETRSPVRGYWEITRLGSQKLAKLKPLSIQRPQRLSGLKKKVMDHVEHVVESIKRGEVAAIVRLKGRKITIQLGDRIKETQVISGSA